MDIHTLILQGLSEDLSEDLTEHMQFELHYRLHLLLKVLPEQRSLGRHFFRCTRPAVLIKIPVATHVTHSASLRVHIHRIDAHIGS